MLFATINIFFQLCISSERTIQFRLEPHKSGTVAQVVQHPLWDREVMNLIPGCAIPQVLKIVAAATLLGAQRNRTSRLI